MIPIHGGNRMIMIGVCTYTPLHTPQTCLILLAMDNVGKYVLHRVVSGARLCREFLTATAAHSRMLVVARVVMYLTL